MLEETQATTSDRGALAIIGNLHPSDQVPLFLCISGGHVESVQKIRTLVKSLDMGCTQKKKKPMSVQVGLGRVVSAALLFTLKFSKDC